MKTKSSLPTIAWALLGMLAIAALALGIGKDNGDSYPSTSSYQPSGTRAFSDLLQKQGYQTQLNHSSSPWLKDSPVLVAFYLDRRPSDTESQARKYIDDYVRKGGRAILLGLSDDFATASTTAESNVDALKQTLDPAVTLKVNMDQVEPANAISFSEALSEQSTFETQPTPKTTVRLAAAPIETASPAVLEVRGSGRLLRIEDGIVATNRFIDKNDNADQLLRWVGTIAPAKSQLVFMEASFGNGENPGIFDALGSWSYAAWLEVLFLFVVVVYTLGKPFGYADEHRAPQRGARDLVEAVAFLYRRAKATGPVLARAYEDADHEVRNKLKLPSEASDEERNRRLPSALAQELIQTKEWSLIQVAPSDALLQVRRLDRLLADFLGEKRSVRRRRKTM